MSSGKSCACHAPLDRRVPSQEHKKTAEMPVNRPAGNYSGLTRATLEENTHFNKIWNGPIAAAIVG
jgi:hypothetical protein